MLTLDTNNQLSFNKFITTNGGNRDPDLQKIVGKFLRLFCVCHMFVVSLM